MRAQCRPWTGRPWRRRCRSSAWPGPAACAMTPPERADSGPKAHSAGAQQRRRAGSAYLRRSLPHCTPVPMFEPTSLPISLSPPSRRHAARPPWPSAHERPALTTLSWQACRRSHRPRRLGTSAQPADEAAFVRGAEIGPSAPLRHAIACRQCAAHLGAVPRAVRQARVRIEAEEKAVAGHADVLKQSQPLPRARAAHEHRRRHTVGPGPHGIASQSPPLRLLAHLRLAEVLAGRDIAVVGEGIGRSAAHPHDAWSNLRATLW
jgi:hypothetical protein